MSEAGEGQLDVLREPAVDRNIGVPGEKAKLVFNLPPPNQRPNAPLIWKMSVNGDMVVSPHLRLSPGEYAAMCPGSREPNPRGGRSLNVRRQRQSQNGVSYQRYAVALPYIDNSPALDLAFSTPGCPRPLTFSAEQRSRVYRLADYLTLRLWHYGWIDTDRAGLLELLNTDPADWDLQFDSDLQEQVRVPVALPELVFYIINDHALNFYDYTGGDTFKTRSPEADVWVDTFGQENYTDKPWLWEVYQKTVPDKLKPIEYFYRQWALDQPEEKDKVNRLDRTWYTNAESRFGKTLRAVFAIEHALAECWVVSADGLSQNTIKSHVPVRGRPASPCTGTFRDVQSEQLLQRLLSLEEKLDTIIRHLPTR